MQNPMQSEQVNLHADYSRHLKYLRADTLALKIALIYQMEVPDDLVWQLFWE